MLMGQVFGLRFSVFGQSQGDIAEVIRPQTSEVPFPTGFTPMVYGPLHYAHHI